MTANFGRLGSWNVICQCCGAKFKREQIKKQWNNLLVCFKCFDVKHPILKPLPIVRESQPVMEANPRSIGFDVSPAWESFSKWGGPYKLDNGQVVSNITCSSLKITIGGINTSSNYTPYFP